ncbi:hypothetical protein WJX72_000590 [[Myrmecia] bisecta]|uniref:Uncharacterized protein n=1 Tax=[Myrmecia] bisecta TaxID=41462 RepID=A0AAW1PRZ7_9CHLO
MSVAVTAQASVSVQALSGKQQPQTRSPGILLACPSLPSLRPQPRRSARLHALGNSKDKNTITRDDEPEEYWQTAAERKGENPIKDPLAIIGLLAILSPFLILGVAIGTGYVDLNAGK